jgi:hypothetical protein
MTNWWVSTDWATAGISTDEDMIITSAAPIWKKFVGQRFSKLMAWLQTKSKFLDVVELQ